MRLRMVLILTLLATACAPAVEPPAAEVVEATSLAGEPLYRPELPEGFHAEQVLLLGDAERAWEKDSTDADALIWIGRRQAYLGRYRDAVETFGRGIERFPDDARFYRHRGHRLITLRRFEEAIADLERGIELAEGAPDAVEPDGLPNERGIPRSTLHTNLWYHLALAHYLQGDFSAAASAFRACFERSPNDDMRVAASYWLYLTLRRLGRDGEAAAVLEPITADLEILENNAYHQLLLMFKGEIEPDTLLVESEPGTLGHSTAGYGVGAWHLVEGRDEQARELFEQIVDGEGWAAFGYLAAESELAR